MSSNFCPAPWIGLFIQGNTTSICCADAKKTNMSPEEFRNSKYLQHIKKQFSLGITPENCRNCEYSESQGLQSIREHFVKKYPEYNQNTINHNTILPVNHIELRSSNLCNLSCRMCNATNSVEIEREINNNTSLLKWYKKNDVGDINESNWKEVLNTTSTLKDLFLTGGEPQLMKEYYDLMDYCIENGTNKDIRLVIYTNCTVYNPKFIEKLLQFKNVVLNLSIDGVGKTAEYQRKGTDWNVVEKNVKKFLELPVELKIHSTITAYSILDFFELAKYYNILVQHRNDIKFMTHTANFPKPLHYSNLSGVLKDKAVHQIELSLVELSGNKFEGIIKELKNILTELKNSDRIHSIEFLNMTKDLDLIRNESFVEVFHLK